MMRMPQRLPLLVGISAFLSIALALLAAILFLNSGRFIYTLDDAYIHLALAERIASGHYGINLVEYSSPSSSILWPFLLAPFQRFSFAGHGGNWIGELAPLALNFLAALLTVPIFSSLAHKIVPQGADKTNRKVRVVVMLLLVTGSNLIGLIFTGMEHSLQLLATLAVLDGALAIAEGESPRIDFYAAVILGPLLRYENLAISAAALVFLYMRARGRTALIQLLVILVPMAAFSVFLKSLGLPVLPTSIFAKSSFVASHGAVIKAVGGLYINLQSPIATLEALAMIALVAFAWISKAPKGERQWAGCAAAAAGLHLVVGRFGWFNRYEVSSYLFALLTTAYMARHFLATRVFAKGSLRLAACMATAVLLLLHNYLSDLLLVPLASNNIYEQHFQMRRFAAEFYPKPVAVMDLGCVAYRNPNYVLDLSGLASYEARKHLQNADSPVWMDRMAEKYSVTWAMVYDIPAVPVPEHWRRMGTMKLGKRRITPAGAVVAFYAITDSAYQDILGLLPAFQQSLPRGVVFQVEAQKIPTHAVGPLTAGSLPGRTETRAGFLRGTWGRTAPE